MKAIEEMENQAGDGLEFTVAHLGLGDEDADVRTKKWVTGQVTSGEVEQEVNEKAISSQSHVESPPEPFLDAKAEKEAAVGASASASQRCGTDRNREEEERHLRKV